MRGAPEPPMVTMVRPTHLAVPQVGEEESEERASTKNWFKWLEELWNDTIIFMVLLSVVRQQHIILFDHTTTK